MTHSSNAGETEPLELWAEAAGRALADTGARGAVTGIDEVAVVRCDSWSYDAPARRLAERLALWPRRYVDSDLGGYQPQVLLHAVCDAIAGRQMALGLVVSGEALHTVGVLARAGEHLGWSHPAPVAPPVELGTFFHDSEVRHGMLPIMRSFALRDSARRAHAGVDVASYAQEPAPVYAAMSEVATGNPYAWHAQHKRAEEIALIGPENRMPVRPYPKLMMASPNVNQAAALLVASHARADELGVPADRRVYLRGWASARDHPYVAENGELWRSRAMAVAARHALRAAGLGVDDVGRFDLYSCFPASVRFSADALGIQIDDPRGMTVTGGMPYAGAPGSGYVTHALAAMTETLRREGRSSGVVSGLSAQMASHAFTVLSTDPPGGGVTADGSAAPDDGRQTPIPIVDAGWGPAVLEAYAVACTREGDNDVAVTVCRLPDERRCYAQADDPDLLGLLSESEGVGRRVELAAGAGGVTRIVG